MRKLEIEDVLYLIAIALIVLAIFIGGGSDDLIFPG